MRFKMVCLNRCIALEETSFVLRLGLCSGEHVMGCVFLNVYISCTEHMFSAVCMRV